MKQLEFRGARQTVRDDWSVAPAGPQFDLYWYAGHPAVEYDDCDESLTTGILFDSAQWVCEYDFRTRVYTGRAVFGIAYFAVAKEDDEYLLRGFELMYRTELWLAPFGVGCIEDRVAIPAV